MICMEAGKCSFAASKAREGCASYTYVQRSLARLDEYSTREEAEYLLGSWVDVQMTALNIAAA